MKAHRNQTALSPFSFPPKSIKYPPLSSAPKRHSRPLLAWLRVCLAALFVSSGLTLHAAPGNEHWDVQFGPPGVTNAIFAVAVNQEMVYVGGQSPNGGRTNTPLSVWDGKQWSVPAMFVGPSVVSIFDLAFVGNNLYVAGNFTNVNGTTARGLAKWDGTAWSGIGFSGTASALAVDGNNLYVGGSYTNVGAGGVMLTNIGYWDGSAWQAMGTGVPVSAGYSVKALAVQNGRVYAGGLFLGVAQQITNLCVWDGASWTGVGGGVLSQITALGFYNSALCVGGLLTKAGGVTVSGVATWDGVDWSALNGGVAGGSALVSSLASYNGRLYVIGSFNTVGGVHATNFASWDGVSWSAAGNLSSTGNRLIVDGGKLYAAGGFSILGTNWVNEIAAFDGSHWSSFGALGRQNGVQDVVSALASDGTNIYAGGFFQYAGKTNANFIARFDGTNWSPVGAGLNNRVTALAVSNNLVYAGGFFTLSMDLHPLNHIGCWDGTNWNAVGDPGGVVYALALSPRGLLAAGSTLSGSSFGPAFFKRWDGTNWNSMFAFIPNSTFFATPLSDPVGYNSIAVQGTNIYMGGNILGFTQFDPAVGFDPATNCQNIMQFKNGFGYIMGTGLNNTNFALAALGTNLYAGGLFTQAGGLPANQIARWDGNAWSSIGAGVVGSGTVLALTALGNNLYAAGTFTNMDHVPANRIAKWDGTTWSALGDGTSGAVQSLTSAGADVFVGGSGFRLAGGKSSLNFARWNEQLNFNVPQLLGAWTTNGQFVTRLSGVSGLTNIIQASTNFSTWTPVLTNTTGIYDFTDPNSAAIPARFYRALLGP